VALDVAETGALHFFMAFGWSLSSAFSASFHSIIFTCMHGRYRKIDTVESFLSAQLSLPATSSDRWTLFAAFGRTSELRWAIKMRLVLCEFKSFCRRPTRVQGLSSIVSSILGLDREAIAIGKLHSDRELLQCVLRRLSRFRLDAVSEALRDSSKCLGD
jgi:hypothetical protein